MPLRRAHRSTEAFLNRKRAPLPNFENLELKEKRVIGPAERLRTIASIVNKDIGNAYDPYAGREFYRHTDLADIEACVGTVQALHNLLGLRYPVSKESFVRGKYPIPL